VIVGRTGETKNIGSLGRRRNRIWLLRASGSCASRRYPLRANGRARAAARGTGPASADCSWRQPSNRCACRRQARPRSESCVGVVRAGRYSNRNERGSLARRRVVGKSRRQSGTRRRTGYLRASAIIRSPRVGLSPGRARLARRTGRRRHEVGRSIASVPRRSAGSPSRRGSFGRRGLARAHFGFGCQSVCSRRTAASLTVAPFRASATEYGDGAASRVGRKAWLSRTWSSAIRSFERPSNNGLEPSRSLSCAIMSLQRAAQTARWAALPQA
jgi:hypothetical protein